MIILGIDPGIADTGWGIIKSNKNQFKVIDYGSIKTKAGQDIGTRLFLLHQQLFRLLTKYKPDKMGVEKVFFGVNTKTATVVGQARGVVLLAASQKRIPIFEYTPLEVKIAITGYGRAEKKQMQKMVQTILKLKKIPRPDDAADALAIALCACFTQKR